MDEKAATIVLLAGRLSVANRNVVDAIMILLIWRFDVGDFVIR